MGLSRMQKSVSDRIDELEEKVKKLEEAAYVFVVGDEPQVRHTWMGPLLPHAHVGVNKLFKELCEQLGYEFTYQPEEKAVKATGTLSKKPRAKKK